ncbi:MAG: hypothetical protein M1828_003508 [Chrysothrix sp. TS-e1954]|nr:MAG: hypothetical protein M1828_003508 [Chrysothrix sp. TS-e1954]
MLSEAELGFFSGFLDFEANKDASGQGEFTRLSRHRKWVAGSKTHKKYENAFNRLKAVGNVDDATNALQSNAKPKKDRVTAAELTPDWILADTLKHLSLGGKTAPDPLQQSINDGAEDSDSEDDGVVIGYFDKHPDFEANRTAPIQEEFRRLAEANNWQDGTEKFWNEYRTCLDQELASSLKSRISNITPLQSLCKDVGADPVPASNSQCRKYLAQYFINIFDYINAKRASTPVPVFTTRTAYRRYTKRDMIFPKSVAKNNKILSSLLEKTFGYPSTSFIRATKLLIDSSAIFKPKITRSKTNLRQLKKWETRFRRQHITKNYKILSTTLIGHTEPDWTEAILRASQKSDNMSDTGADDFLPHLAGLSLDEGLAITSAGRTASAFETHKEQFLMVYHSYASPSEPEVQRQSFFDSYPTFVQNHRQDIRNEFDRLAKHCGWDKFQRRKFFIECLTAELRYWAQQHAPDLTVLQQLCIDLGVEDPPSSITQCKRALAGSFVNIYDYINCKRKGSAIKPIFEDYKLFRNYMKDSKKIFPKIAIKPVKGLKEMLEIIAGFRG